RIRPGFVLLQTGMGLGVIDAAAALMRQADQQQGHCNTHLELRAGDVAEKSAQLRERIRRIAATPHERSRAYAIEYVQVRLDVSEFCLKAVQSAMLHWGARGYLEGSAVPRPMREAWFVAIIT